MPATAMSCDMTSIPHTITEREIKNTRRCIIALKATSVLSFIPHFPLSWIVMQSSMHSPAKQHITEMCNADIQHICNLIPAAE